jgi:glutamyl-tRNA reductase
VPRNIDADVQRLDNVYLYNIDDLQEIVCANMQNREQDLALCHRIIGTAATALMEKLNSRKDRRYEAGLPFDSRWAFSAGAAIGRLGRRGLDVPAPAI